MCYNNFTIVRGCLLGLGPTLGAKESEEKAHSPRTLMVRAYCRGGDGIDRSRGPPKQCTGFPRHTVESIAGVLRSQRQAKRWCGEAEQSQGGGALKRVAVARQPWGQRRPKIAAVPLRTDEKGLKAACFDTMKSPKNH
jgi:hypothetical protein